MIQMKQPRLGIFTKSKSAMERIAMGVLVLLCLCPSHAFNSLHHSKHSMWRISPLFEKYHPSLIGNSNKINNHSKRKQLSVLRQAVSSSATAEEAQPISGGSAGIPASTFNLVKTCAGSGVLALPAGVAAMGDVPSVLVPAIIIVCVMGSISAYSFFTMVRLSHWDDTQPSNNKGEIQKTKSIGKIWEQEIGENTSWIVQLSCLLTPLAFTLSYSIVLGDTISSLSQTFGLTGILATRQASILFATLGVLYPLCQMKSLAALAKISMLGVSGTFLICIFMMIRALPGGPYFAVGKFVKDLHPSLLPSFGQMGSSKVFSPSMSILASMAGTAYLTQFATHDFYDGLKNPSLKRFGIVTCLGYILTTIINLSVMSFGFLTFGGASQGIILNNYSTKDLGAIICRGIVAISLFGSYPIMMRGIKSSYFELTQKGVYVH
jgi:sodium-coupled neutral amino acid transporter 11